MNDHAVVVEPIPPSAPGDRSQQPRVILVSACNNLEVFQRYARRSPGVRSVDFHRFDNAAENLPVPVRYNQYIDQLDPGIDAWIAFVHNDFVFLEDPRAWLGVVPKDHLYGVVGADVVAGDKSNNAGAVISRDPGGHAYVVRGQVECSPSLIASGMCGVAADGMVPATTVDCCCVIAHSSLLLRHGIRFDESFAWHLYSEELSLRARRRWGVRTFVLPIRAGHYGRGLIDDSFRAGAKRLYDEYSDGFVSTCFNPVVSRGSVTSAPAGKAGVDETGEGAEAIKMAATVPGTLGLSIVLVIHRMARQAARTLATLSPNYQRGISSAQYEVLIYENESDDQLTTDAVAALPANFRYTLIQAAHPSPVFALNRGIREARGRVIGAMIDGARMVTPGLLRRALFAARVHPRSVITTMGWYLGCDVQGHGLNHGYSAAYEDELLQGIAWPSDPYRLFEISTPDQSSVDGWVGSIAESNALFMSREMWRVVGGYDERFTSPGGGLANHDLLKRACETPNAQHVLLSDEATFHQAHGGIATNAEPDRLQMRLKEWSVQYESIRGGSYTPPDQRSRVLFGAVRPQLASHWFSALGSPVRQHLRLDARPGPYLAESEKWPVRRPPSSAAATTSIATAKGLEPGAEKSPEPPINAFVWELFKQHRLAEARDVCRLALSRYGHGRHTDIERILSQCANVREDPAIGPPRRRSAYLRSLARARMLLGEVDEAEVELRRSLELDPANDWARFDLASIRLPGDSYLERLADVHEFHSPRVYLEIGVFQGESIALARPPSIAFGVDPVPALGKPCKVETRIYPCTSDQFFHRNARHRLIQRRVDFGFIDGLHDFKQVVRDFWHMERLCDPNSIIAFHDTLPLDRRSSTKKRSTGFWTGDVWKIIPFLMTERPDLQIATIKAPPSGLTLVGGLSPSHSATLAETMVRAVAYDALDYREFDESWRARMLLVENSRPALADWLLFRGVRASDT